jgi:hypothetical protein
MCPTKFHSIEWLGLLQHASPTSLYPEWIHWNYVLKTVVLGEIEES